MEASTAYYVAVFTILKFLACLESEAASNFHHTGKLSLFMLFPGGIVKTGTLQKSQLFL